MVLDSLWLCTQHGWNALISAASRGHLEVCEYLLQKRANALVLDVHDCDAAAYARQNKHDGVAELLEKAMTAQIAAVREAAVMQPAMRRECLTGWHDTTCYLWPPLLQGFTPTSKPSASHWSCTDSCTVS